MSDRRIWLDHPIVRYTPTNYGEGTKKSVRSRSRKERRILLCLLSAIFLRVVSCLASPRVYIVRWILPCSVYSIRVGYWSIAAMATVDWPGLERFGIVASFAVFAEFPEEEDCSLHRCHADTWSTFGWEGELKQDFHWSPSSCIMTNSIHSP